MHAERKRHRQQKKEARPTTTAAEYTELKYPPHTLLHAIYLVRVLECECVCAKCYQRCGGGRWCWWLFLASFHQQKHIEWSIPPAYWHVVNFFLLSQLLTAIVDCAKPVAIRIDRLDKQKGIHRVKKTEKRKEKQQQKKHRKNVMWLERNWMAQNIQRKLCKLLGITHSLTHIVSLYLVCRDFAVCVSLSSWVVAVAFYGQCMCVYFFIFSPVNSILDLVAHTQHIRVSFIDKL